MDKANQLINALTEYLVEQEQRYLYIQEQIQGLDSRITKLEEADPVDPVDPTIEIIGKGSLKPGDNGVFEAIMSDTETDQILKVEFFVNGQIENVEFNAPYESWPVIPYADFTIGARFYLNDGSMAMQEKGFAVDQSGGGGNPPPDVSADAYDKFVEESDGSWFAWKASDLTVGDYSGDAIADLYNSSDQKTGNPKTRATAEDVPEFGGARMLNVYGNQDSSNYSNRLAIPKDAEYQAASEVAVKLQLGFLKHNETGIPGVDRRTYKPFHWKGFGIQPVGGPPPSGSNPVIQRGKCEFVLQSHYGFNAVSGTNKGDQTAVELGQPTAYGDAVKSNPDAYYFHQVGLYAHDVTDYKYQSQIFPTVPDADGNMTSERLAFTFDQVYTHFFIIKGNTFVDGDDQQDGQFTWILQSDSLNNGEPFVTAKLTGRSFTTGSAAQFARGGMGMYINPGDQQPKNTFYGFFVGEHETYYKL